MKKTGEPHAECVQKILLSTTLGIQMRLNRHIVGAIALMLATGGAGAQPADPLRTSVEQAVNSNPEVTARFNAYRASLDAVDVARAGFLPRLDLSANVGRNTDRITTRSPETENLNRREAGLTLTQLLWDGMGTKNDVSRAGHDRLARYFELLDVTEQTALEAARAHFDVQRYRRLVQLAEDNYVQHRYAYLQIQSRVRAGVGRGVDLEQAAARVALAESNLTTEVANLHDVLARYQRVVGIPAPKNLPTISMLKSGLPATPTEAMNTAVRQSAAISAERCGESAWKPACPACSVGNTSDRSSPPTTPGYVMTSGMMKCSRSMSVTATLE